MTNVHFILSPAKKLDESPCNAPDSGNPELLSYAEKLMSVLKTKAPQDLAALMHISDNIAVLNAERNARWAVPFSRPEAVPAVYLFNGDAYAGLDVRSLNNTETGYLNHHLSILSGLYGLLRPSDLILPYRLEMGTKLHTGNAADLYAFWGDIITDALNRRLKEHGDNTLVNVASGEYFKAVRPKRLQAALITPIFRERTASGDKTIGIYAKRARGMMVRFAAQNAISHAEDLRDFDMEGYRFDPASSDADKWVFVR